ncbi:MAG TPA: hypothetical protein VF472_12365 [Burkholderiaceae bacterium]
MSQSTMNMASAADPAMGSSSDPDSGSDSGQDQGGGFAIILAFQQDGSIQVVPQGGDSGQGDGSSDEQGQPQVVDSLQDAFQVVEQLAQENGYAGQDDGGSAGNGGDDGGDGNAELDPDDAQSAWNQLAAKSDKRRLRGM